MRRGKTLVRRACHREIALKSRRLHIIGAAVTRSGERIHQCPERSARTVTEKTLSRCKTYSYVSLHMRIHTATSQLVTQLVEEELRIRSLLDCIFLVPHNGQSQSRCAAGVAAELMHSFRFLLAR